MIPEDVEGTTVQLLHSPVHAQTLAYKQQITAFFEWTLTNKILWSDQQLVQPSQSVGICFVTCTAEAKIPITLCFTCNIVEDLLKEGVFGSRSSLFDI